MDKDFYDFLTKRNKKPSSESVLDKVIDDRLSILSSLIIKYQMLKMIDIDKYKESIICDIVSMLFATSDNTDECYEIIRKSVIVIDRAEKEYNNTTFKSPALSDK